MKRRNFLKAASAALLALVAVPVSAALKEEPKENIIFTIKGSEDDVEHVLTYPLAKLEPIPTEIVKDVVEFMISDRLQVKGSKIFMDVEFRGETAGISFHEKYRRTNHLVLKVAVERGLKELYWRQQRKSILV